MSIELEKAHDDLIRHVQDVCMCGAQHSTSDMRIQRLSEALTAYCNEKGTTPTQSIRSALLQQEAVSMIGSYVHLKLADYESLKRKAGMHDKFVQPLIEALTEG